MLKTRCAWVPLDKPDYVAYHDEEWGRPVHDDRKLFETLVLEGAQAGLSWYTILRRRAEYQRVFLRFDPKRVAALTDVELSRILADPGIIRNRRKVQATRTNAQVFLRIQKEYGSFDVYLWGFVGGKPIVRRPRRKEDVVVSIPQAQALSKDLEKRGMSFVGESIAYSLMQAVGLVDDHQADCFLARRNTRNESTAAKRQP